MSISQSQAIRDVLPTSLKGILSSKPNTAKESNESFRVVLNTVSEDIAKPKSPIANVDRHNTGSSVPQRGKELHKSDEGDKPNNNVQQSSTTEMSEEGSAEHIDAGLKDSIDVIDEALIAQVDGVDVETDVATGSVKEILASEGIDLEKLEQQVVDAGLMSAAEFDELLKSPEAFFAQLDQWLQQNPQFSQAISIQLPQLAELVKKEVSSQTKNDINLVSAETLSESSAESDGISKLVSKLLDEKGQQQQSSEDNLSKDRFLAQMLQQKSADPMAKPSGFAFDLAASLPSASDKVTSSTALVPDSLANHSLRVAQGVDARMLPQMPILKGLPGQPGATEALNERIMMMRAKGLQMAEIRLDPPELGALTVKVKVTGDSTSIQFHSPHPEVREALESQVLRLREMMDGAGINLGDVGVSDQSLSERPSESHARNDADRGSSEELDDGASSQPIITRQSLGLVDYFA